MSSLVRGTAATQTGGMNVEVHDLVGAYAVDALPEEERRFFERHLDDCAQCRGEVGELQVTAALLGAAAEEAPPEGLRDQVLAAAAVTPQERAESSQASGGMAAAAPTGARAPAAPSGPAASASAWGARERIRQLLPAVAAVIVLGVAGVTVVATQAGVAPAPEDGLAALVAAPDARIVDLRAPEGSTAKLVWSAEREEAIFLTDGLQAAPQGQAYALWIIAGDSPPALAGMFRPDADGQARHVISNPSSTDAVTVAVTVEPEDGVEAPTSDPIIVGEL